MATRKTTTTTSDPARAYAEGVVRGKIVAGPDVRAACARHLSDLRDAPKRGFVYDRRLADHYANFFPKILRLNGGVFEGDPFVLLPWQEFIVRSLFGWRRSDDGTRRFRMAYIETGKGSGKSPLAAGIGLAMMVVDDEPRAEIYAAATKKDQAQILFRDAVAMVKLSPRLNRAILLNGRNPVWNMLHERSGSFFRPIATDSAQSGPRPHCGLIDELHEHPDASVLEMMRAGTKGRRQALIFMITNAGSTVHSVCHDYHEYAVNCANGTFADDTFFSYVCAMDEADDPMHDEACWLKTNPSLGVTIQPEYIREQVRQARNMPSKEAWVKRLHFCKWTDARSPWIGVEQWDAAADHALAVEMLRDRPCYGGLDMGQSRDLTALVLAFEPTTADPVWRLLPYFWLPKDGLAVKADNDRVPYTVWHADGHMETTDGPAIDPLAIVRRIGEVAHTFRLKRLAYDRWGIERVRQLMVQEGIEVELYPFGQGYKDMGPAVNEFERLLVSGTLKHNGNPVLRWNAANAELRTDPTGARKPAKDKAIGRIDGIVAAVMAVGCGAMVKDAPQPKYQMLFVG